MKICRVCKRSEEVAAFYPSQRNICKACCQVRYIEYRSRKKAEYLKRKAADAGQVNAPAVKMPCDFRAANFDEYPAACQACYMKKCQAGGAAA